MPKYTASPAKDLASGFFEAPDDIYEVLATNVKPFEKANKADVMTHGVRIAIKIAEGAHKDKQLSPIKLYYHTEGGASYAKSILMAIFGKNEIDFNTMAADKDWGMDPDTGAVGDGFMDIKGKRFKVQTEQTIIPNSDPPKIQVDIKNVFAL